MPPTSRGVIDWRCSTSMSPRSNEARGSLLWPAPPTAPGRNFIASTIQSRGVPVCRGAPLFCPRRAHLLTTRKRAVVLPDGSRALSEGDCAFCGKRPPMPSGIDGATGKFTPVSLPVASENLPLAAFRCLRGTQDDGRETKDGGNRNWQFIIWRQKLSAGVQGVPLLRQQPT